MNKLLKSGYNKIFNGRRHTVFDDPFKNGIPKDTPLNFVLWENDA